MTGFRFQIPPGWPPAPPGWVPPEGWQPPLDWPPAPPGWQFWVLEDQPSADPAPDPSDSVSTEQPAEAVATQSTGEQEFHQEPEEPAGEADADELDDLPSEENYSPDLEEAAPEALDAESQMDASDPDEEHPEAEPETGQATQQEAPPAVTSEASVASDDSGSAKHSRSDVERLVRQRDNLEKEVERLRRRLDGFDVLADVGIYQYRHPLDSSAEYKAQLEHLRDEIKESVRAGHAIEASDMFAYNNSLAQGRRMVRDLSTLMLRAYNAEAENCVRTVRAGSVPAAVARLGRSVEAVAKLGSMMDMRVSPDFHAMRVREIELTGDFLMKVQAEREEAREERARLREERRAEAELAAERERLEKEKSHYLNALASLVAQGKSEDAAEIERRLLEIDGAIEANDYRAANIRAGYVYVISNIGAFGADVVKIGMTRRLEPMDRIRELGDASVPFPFDVHAIYFSDDAVSLENSLHKRFADRRINQVNLRREFFYATPEQVKEVLATQVGNLLEFTDEPEAEQYRQSVTIRESLEESDNDTAL